MTGENIKELLCSRQELDPDDAFKLSHDDHSKVDDFLWCLVEDLEAFMSLPWGTYI